MCKRNIYLAQIAEMGKLPSEAALISDLRAFGADQTNQKGIKNTTFKIKESSCISFCTFFEL